MGIPFLSGFYSKDLIIELQAGSYLQFSSFFFLLLASSAVLTAFYSGRLVFYVFLNKPLFRYQQTQIADASLWVQVPLTILALLSICSGFWFEDLFVGTGSTFFAGAITVLPQQWYSLNFEYIPYLFSQLPLFGSCYGVWFSLRVFLFRNYYYYYIYISYCRTMFLMNRWGFDFVYNNILLRLFFSLLQHFYYFLDKGIIEYFGPTGLYNMVSSLSRRLAFLQNGSLTTYIQFISFSFIVLVVGFPLIFQIF
jgi:NADH-ubiquinone oxidoreductase chain 5